MTNQEIRLEYQRIVAEIRPLNQRWIQEERLPPRERALRAYRIRRQARLDMRARMQDPLEVEMLRRRDASRYGNPDGPAFEQLLAIKMSRGLTEEQAYAEIIESAARTDRATDRRVGL